MNLHYWNAERLCCKSCHRNSQVHWLISQQSQRNQLHAHAFHCVLTTWILIQMFHLILSTSLLLFLVHCISLSISIHCNSSLPATHIVLTFYVPIDSISVAGLGFQSQGLSWYRTSCLTRWRPSRHHFVLHVCSLASDFIRFFYPSRILTNPFDRSSSFDQARG